MEPSPPLNIREYHELARAKLSAMAYAYFAGGAEDEITLRENSQSFDRLRLRPRVLVDVSRRELGTKVLGLETALPVVIAPLAFMRLAHPEGELAVARAAAAAGLIMTASTLATTSLEEIAQGGMGAPWFQLYVYQDREVTRDLVQRAESAGYRALMITVDAAASGKRERDVRGRFRLPEDLSVPNLAPYLTHPEEQSHRRPGAADYPSVPNFDASLDWTDLDWLCNLTRLPVLVKGILRADDAERAVQHGAQGIVVSNHGGRQLDTAISGVEALPDIVAAVDMQAEVLVDGGVRRGTHVLKSLALGARAVLVGRPILWGLAVAGQQGVGHVLEILRQEFDTAMALCGCARVEDIEPGLIA